MLSPKGQPGDTARCIPQKDESLGSYWDAFSAYDFMLSVGVRPMVELSFTPNPLVAQWQPGMPNPQECNRKTAMRSRFVALSVSPVLKAWPLQTSTTTRANCRRRT